MQQMGSAGWFMFLSLWLRVCSFNLLCGCLFGVIQFVCHCFLFLHKCLMELGGSVLVLLCVWLLQCILQLIPSSKKKNIKQTQTNKETAKTQSFGYNYSFYFILFLIQTQGYFGSKALTEFHYQKQ
jgi:hypothetical protein